MTSTHHTGRAARIREFLKEHPDSLCRHIARALGEEAREVNHELKRMAALGMVRMADEGFAKKRYSLVANYVPPPRKPRTTNMHKGASRNPKTDQLMFYTEPRRAIPAMTSEDFIKAGGKIEVLPSFGSTPHASPSYSIQHEGLTRAHR